MAEEARKHCSALKVLFITGFAGNSVVGQRHVLRLAATGGVEDAVSHLSEVTRTISSIGRASVFGFAGHPTMRGGKLPSSLLVACIP